MKYEAVEADCLHPNPACKVLHSLFINNSFLKTVDAVVKLCPDRLCCSTFGAELHAVQGLGLQRLEGFGPTVDFRLRGPFCLCDGAEGMRRIT